MALVLVAGVLAEPEAEAAADAGYHGYGHHYGGYGHQGYGQE